MSYNWNGMKKLTYEEVVEICKDGIIGGFFLLYDDNTEADAVGYSWEEIEKHYKNGGEFGVEVGNI